MDGPGTVTWEEFLENAERFLVVSDEVSDGWEFLGNKVYYVYYLLNNLVVRILTYKSSKNVKYAN